MIAPADIQCVLSPARADDLRTIFRVTPARLRPAIAMTFAEIVAPQWAELAGVEYVTLWRWLTKDSRLVLGAAVRLSRVFGVPADELFEDWV